MNNAVIVRLSLCSQQSCHELAYCLQCQRLRCPGYANTPGCNCNLCLACLISCSVFPSSRIIPPAHASGCVARACETVRGCATGGPAGRFWEEAESKSHFAGVVCRALGLAQGLSLVRITQRLASSCISVRAKTLIRSLKP